MIITLKQLKARIKKHGSEYYRYIGRWRREDGIDDYAVINDCYTQETLHVYEDDDIISAICGECES